MFTFVPLTPVQPLHASRFTLSSERPRSKFTATDSNDYDIFMYLDNTCLPVKFNYMYLRGSHLWNVEQGKDLWIKDGQTWTIKQNLDKTQKWLITHPACPWKLDPVIPNIKNPCIVICSKRLFKCPTRFGSNKTDKRIAFQFSLSQSSYMAPMSLNEKRAHDYEKAKFGQGPHAHAWPIEIDPTGPVSAQFQRDVKPRLEQDGIAVIELNKQTCTKLAALILEHVKHLQGQECESKVLDKLPLFKRKRTGSVGDYHATAMTGDTHYGWYLQELGPILKTLAPIFSPWRGYAHRPNIIISEPQEEKRIGLYESVI